MSNNKTNVSVMRISTVTIIGIVFIILKLCGVINWSWVWVLAPFWIPVALVIFIFGVITIWAII